MAQTKILVDTSSYLRLAQNIHPLLSAPFGRANYTLYAHGDLLREFERQPRLQSKFHWFTEADYVANRSRPLQLGRKEMASIDRTFEYMWAHVKEENLGPSPVDTKILATAAELNLRPVTDDVDLIGLAAMYGVHTMTSLELMKLMLTEGHINMDRIHLVVSQWNFDRDLPANFRRDYQVHFGDPPPTD